MPKRDEKKGKPKGFAISVFWGAATGFIVIFVLFMIASSLVLSGKLPESAMKTPTAVAAIFGSAAGSVVSIKRYKSRILATGLTCGAAMFIVMLIGSVSSNTKGAFNAMTPLLFLMTILGGVLGAVLCSRGKKRKRG